MALVKKTGSPLCCLFFQESMLSAPSHRFMKIICRLKGFRVMDSARPVDAPALDQVRRDPDAKKDNQADS